MQNEKLRHFIVSAGKVSLWTKKTRTQKKQTPIRFDWHLINKKMNSLSDKLTTMKTASNWNDSCNLKQLHPAGNNKTQQLCSRCWFLVLLCLTTFISHQPGLLVSTVHNSSSPMWLSGGLKNLFGWKGFRGKLHYSSAVRLIRIYQPVTLLGPCAQKY